MVRVVIVLLALWFAATAAAVPVIFEHEVRSGDFPRWLVTAASIVSIIVSFALLLVAKGA